MYNGGSYKIEGHGPEIWCYDGPASRMRFDNQTFPMSTGRNSVYNLGASENFLNPSHADVLPVSVHKNPDARVQSSEGDSPEDLDFSDAVLKYINHILMEEDVEEKSGVFAESAALQAAEKSFYEVIVDQRPASVDYQHASSSDQTFQHPDEKLFRVNDLSGSYDSGTLSSDWNSDPNCDRLDLYHHTAKRNSQSTSQCSCASSSTSSNGTIIEGPTDSPVSTLRIPDIFGDSQSAMQFKKGVEEASKFLPNGNNLAAALGYDDPLPREGSANISVKVEKKIDNNEVNDVLRGKKNPYHDSMSLQEERISKQSAVFAESTVSPDMFDRVLLCSGGKNESALREALNEISRNTQQSSQSQVSNGGKTGGKKKQGRNVVDMRTLLTLCAQAVAADDRRTANEFLKQIRQHASPTGDGMQRLALYFSDGLEARMAGSGTQIYKSLLSLPTSAADVLKAYHTYVATCPFRKVSNFFANKTIMNVSKKVTKLHIIDFGILFGFQWPSFLQRLSDRPGGPPRLRITGIDFPCPGFRPSMRVEETGRRLASYAKTFKVQFEFNAIAQSWETIKLEDLKIEKDEMVAVSCLFNFKNLLDETVVVNSPRNIVLNLIKRINPAVFVLGIKNGAYNAPFFLTRFREALFYYSSLFDMLDANIPREVPERMLLEKIIFGREAKNVIACEAAERIERPETYKQWQVRNMRAGFEQLPLAEEITSLAKKRVKQYHHKDFVVDEDGQWLLMGWKGRILYALSSWRPAR